jgi:NAD(P)H-flavin reductase
LIPRMDFDPRQTIALVCGPEIMMRFAVTALRDAGVADEAIYLSMERNMKCAVGFCGHCQLGTVLVCRDGPVFRYDRLRSLLPVKEI